MAYIPRTKFKKKIRKFQIAYWTIMPKKERKVGDN